MLVIACGSEHAPTSYASIDPSGGGPAPGTASAKDAAADASPCTSDAGAVGSCTCTYSPGGMNPTVIIPCGVSACFAGTNERGECSANGKLTVVPNAGTTCPPPDGGASDGGPTDPSRMPCAK